MGRTYYYHGRNDNPCDGCTDRLPGLLRSLHKTRLPEVEGGAGADPAKSCKIHTAHLGD